MTLNELIKAGTGIGNRYTSGDMPLLMDGQEVDVTLRDIVIDGEPRVAMDICRRAVELPEVRLRQEIRICVEQKPAIDELMQRGIVSRATYDLPSCDVEVWLSDSHTTGKTGDWLVLDEQYLWRIMSAAYHQRLAEQGKIVMIDQTLTTNKIMPTGLTADIYEGKHVTLRDFALTCVTQLGAGYFATDQGSKPMPKDKPPVLEPSDYHKQQLEKAERELTHWEEMKGQPDVLKRLYDEWCEERRAYNAGVDERHEAVYARYAPMIAKVEAWDVPEEFASLKELMLEQLKESLEFDYSQKEKRHYDHIIPMDEWLAMNISCARRDIDYHSEEIRKEQEKVDGINGYLRRLYELLDKEADR